MKIFVLVAILVLFPIVASGGVVINGVEISNSGKIIYLDKTEQSTATVKGDPGQQGPQGPQGPKGDPGQVDKTAICQVYFDEGDVPPPFCAKKYIFVTSQKWKGNLGGLDGADAKCQSAALAGGLPGTYKAWLSISTVAAKDRLIHHPGSYIRTDSAVVAINWFDLTDGYLKEPIVCDEFKDCSRVYIEDTSHDRNPTNTHVWTNTSFSGQYYESYAYPVACEEWTSSDSLKYSPVGFHNQIDRTWSDGGSSSCSSSRSLYCIQQ